MNKRLEVFCVSKRRSHLIGVDSNRFESSELRTIMAELNEGFEVGVLPTPGFEGVPFERAVESYEKVAAQTGTVKQIVTL
jgi:hypothetical protein